MAGHEDKHSVMLVDDDPVLLELISANLDEKYNVIGVTSSAECLEKAIETVPDALLLDVNMPEINGYELCQKLRAKSKMRDVPVLFLSARTDLESKLSGYDAGGDDYLTKPIDMQEIEAKLNASIALRKKHKNTVKKTKDMAKAVMNSSAEYGVILAYCERSFQSENNETLASLKEFQLNACVRLHTPSESFAASTDNKDCTSMELDLLKAIPFGNRVTRHGRRIAFNYQYVSLLVKNMPEDEEKSGRYCDHIAMMLNAAVSKVESNYRIQNNERIVISKINDALAGMSNCVREIAQDYDNCEKQITNSIGALISELNVLFTQLELTFEQENTILSLVNGHLDGIVTSFGNIYQMDKKFEKIINSLEEIRNCRVLNTNT